MIKRIFTLYVKAQDTGKSRMKPKFFSQISDHQQSLSPDPSRDLPHPPQLCWWSLIYDRADPDDRLSDKLPLPRTFHVSRKNALPAWQEPSPMKFGIIWNSRKVFLPSADTINNRIRWPPVFILFIRMNYQIGGMTKFVRLQTKFGTSKNFSRFKNDPQRQT